MTSRPTLVGTIRAVDGKAVVRMEDRFDTDAKDLWSALTDPDRLSRWLATVHGDLAPGGEFQAAFVSGWEGPGRVDVCEPPHRLLLTMSPGQPDQTVIEARLTADGDQTHLVVEERGLPLPDAAGYGAGWQAHIEDLAAHLAGEPAGDWRTRWADLAPAYRDWQSQPGADDDPDSALLTFLAAQRHSVLAIIDGMDEVALRRPATPSGWTPLGLIEHLAHAERFWFQHVVTGHADPLPWPSAPQGTPFTTDQPTAAVVDFYRAQCARADTILAATPFSATPRGDVPPDLAEFARSVRTTVLHMIEETARHAGHLDIAREQADGTTGLGPR